MIKVISSLFLGLALLILLRASSYFMNLTMRGNWWYKYILQVFPWVELTLWILFVFWNISFYLENSSLFTIVTLVFTVILMIIFGWYLMRDIVAGVILRSNHILQPGVRVKAGSISGIITHLGYISLEIKDEEGIRVKVNYNKLISRDISSFTESGRGKSHMVTASIAQHYGAQQIEQVLNRKLLEIPWVIAGDDINIKLYARNTDFYEAEMNFYSLNDEMFVKTEEIIRSFIKKTFP